MTLSSPIVSSEVETRPYCARTPNPSDVNDPE